MLTRALIPGKSCDIQHSVCRCINLIPQIIFIVHAHINLPGLMPRRKAMQDPFYRLHAAVGLLILAFTRGRYLHANTHTHTRMHKCAHTLANMHRCLVDDDAVEARTITMSARSYRIVDDC